MMWVNVPSPHQTLWLNWGNWLLFFVLLQKRRGMDIKQMKTFVSEELKGLKQEHRLLSLREYDFYCTCVLLLCYIILLYLCTCTVLHHFTVLVYLYCVMYFKAAVLNHTFSLPDIGASESIMKRKTKQDFQELLKTEHCKNTLRVQLNVFMIIIPTINYLLGFILVYSLFSLPALLEGFEIRDCISFIEEHINRQVLLLKYRVVNRSKNNFNNILVNLIYFIF